MAIALPDPKSLSSALLALDRAITNFELARSNLRFTQTSSDTSVSAVVDGLGRLVSIFIAQSQSSPSITAAALAQKVMDVVNGAVDQASAAGAASVKSFASTLSLPGLPAYGQSPPNYPDFSLIATQLTAQILANIPCQKPDVFSCEYGKVAAVVSAQRRIVSLAFVQPLPEFMADLAAQIMLTLNCAIDKSTPDPNPPTVGIIDSKGLQDVAIYANGTLKLNDRTHIRGIGCAGFAAVANAGNVETNIGVEADVGSITSGAKVVVRDRGRVHGFIESSSNVEQHPGNEIAGPITENGVIILPTLALDVQFPGVTQGTIELEPGQQQTAAPAYYNQCHPKQNAQVFLSSGVYYFNDFFLEPDSKVWLNASSGPIVIWVKNSFTFRGQFLDSAGGFPRVFVGYLGTSMAVVERGYRGTLAAPNAKISVSTVANHEGAFHGKDFEMQPDSELCFHPFELLYSELPGLTPPGGPPAPLVDLGFETVAGWSSPQALLTSVLSPATQGTHSLRVTNVTGLTEIQSADFASTLAPTGSTRLIVDLWVPSNQPNPMNFGTLSCVISIPSAGVNSVNLGSINLTSRPQNQFSSLEFTLTTAVAQALAVARTDVSLKLVLNITPGSGPWYVDNIRFALPAQPPSLDPILSFEDATKWSCMQVTLTTSTQQKTHLLRSLAVSNVPSWFQIISVPFSSATIAAPQSKMRVDLWIPTNQPNPSWHGQVQLFISVPSAGIQDAPSAAIQLTPLPTGRFSTLEFVLPANVKAAIDGTYADVRINLTFNVAAGPGPYYLDNVRFV